MSPASFPPTVIVRDSRENQRKCSILPLRGRPDLVFFTYPLSKDRETGRGGDQETAQGPLSPSPCLPLSLSGYVRLAAAGPELTPADVGSGLLLLDGSWRRAESMTRAFRHVPPRSLHGFKSAYPRVSKKGTDPANGLASVEALFLAFHILGRSTEGLLDHYRWAEKFLRLNGIKDRK